MRAGDSLSPSNVTLTIVAISNTLYQHGSARVLVGLLVFKTSAPVTSWWVGSIPMHFRQLSLKSLSFSFLISCQKRSRN